MLSTNAVGSSSANFVRWSIILHFSRIEVQIACQNIRHVMHIVLTMGYHTLDLGEWVHGSLSLGPLLDSFLLLNASVPR
jgi:hypothetical protein